MPEIRHRIVSGRCELMGRYVLLPMHLAGTFRHLIIGRLRWLLASGDERDAEILACGCRKSIAAGRSVALIDGL